MRSTHGPSDWSWLPQDSGLAEGLGPPGAGQTQLPAAVGPDPATNAGEPIRTPAEPSQTTIEALRSVRKSRRRSQPGTPEHTQASAEEARLESIVIDSARTRVSDLAGRK